LIERIIITGIENPHFSKITGDGPERVYALYSILMHIKGSKSTMIFYTQLSNILEIGALINRKGSIVLMDADTKRYIENIELKNDNFKKKLYDSLMKKEIIIIDK